MDFRKAFISSLLTVIVFVANAQEKVLIKGLVFQKGSSSRIEAVEIQVKNTRNSVKTDEWGNFAIEVNIGDTLLFSKLNYEDTERPVLAKTNLIVYLTKAIALNEVIVKEQSKSKQQQEILDGYRSKGVFYNGDPPILAYIFVPLTALHELLGTDANNAKKFGNYIQRENAQSMVDRHFNEIVIRKAIKIPDSELVEFMYLFRPKPEEAMYWNYYDDMNYVKKSYAKFLQRKKQRLTP
ncbi:carboxypeptidase-like regulatory domain-containing protein [Pedobacter arcticus]|uniref:carboxypeptidase-like regulatory domain-containing protein n=1 Tax=Pedobacter arcticus TaxID=752140 RepID=UPI0002E72A93|nr:carboxypeptidase-like regulatory domain-containing protein [Pedobacter arcticus]